MEKIKARPKRKKRVRMSDYPCNHIYYADEDIYRTDNEEPALETEDIFEKKDKPRKKYAH